MMRYLLAVAGAVALMSNVALAQTVDVGGASTTVIHSGATPDGMGHKRVVVKRHVDRYGHLVTKKKIYREGMSGSSVTRVRKSVDPVTGTVTRERSTELR